MPLKIALGAVVVLIVILVFAIGIGIISSLSDDPEGDTTEQVEED